MDTTKQINRFQFKALDYGDRVGNQTNSNIGFDNFPYKSNIIPSVGDNILGQLSKEQQKEKEPAFSAHDIAEIRQKAFEEGYAKGYNGAKSLEAETEKVIQAMLGEIVLKLSTLSEAVKTTNKHHVKVLSDVALRVAKKVSGSALKQDPYSSIEGVIRAALPLLFDVPKINIYVNPSLVKQIEDRVSVVIRNESFKNDIEILGNPALTYGSCELEWNGGGIKSSKDNIWQQIETLCESL